MRKKVEIPSTTLEDEECLNEKKSEYTNSSWGDDEEERSEDPSAEINDLEITKYTFAGWFDAKPIGLSSGKAYLDAVILWAAKEPSLQGKIVYFF